MPERAAQRRARIGIACPVSTAAEVESLAAHGATELYTGVAPEAWTARYGDVAWLNRRGRGAANPGSGELARIVAYAHAHELTVSVALNSPYYTASQLELLRAICADLAALGVDGLIVGDPGLVLALREGGSTLPIAASSVAALRNSEAVAFFRDLGLRRIILPRHLPLSDILAIRRALPEVELEVFGLNDGCAYEEGHCATTHAAGAFCLGEYRYDFARLDAAPMPDEERALLEQNAEHYREWLWYLAGCGQRLSARGLPNGPCGLCAIWDLCHAGIDCLKIVGREAHPVRKLRSLELVSAIVEEVSAGRARDHVRKLARDVRGTPELCGSGFMCYYREAGLPESAE